jgi:hypothetical protein
MLDEGAEQAAVGLSDRKIAVEMNSDFAHGRGPVADIAGTGQSV